MQQIDQHRASHLLLYLSKLGLSHAHGTMPQTSLSGESSGQSRISACSPGCNNRSTVRLDRGTLCLFILYGSCGSPGALGFCRGGDVFPGRLCAGLGNVFLQQ